MIGTTISSQFKMLKQEISINVKVSDRVEPKHRLDLLDQARLLIALNTG